MHTPHPPPATRYDTNISNWNECLLPGIYMLDVLSKSYVFSRVYEHHLHAIIIIIITHPHWV